MISKFLKRLRIFKRLRELKAQLDALEKMTFKRFQELVTQFDALKKMTSKRFQELETRLDALENALEKMTFKRFQELETRLDALEKKTTALNKLNESKPLSNNLIDEWLNGKEDDK